MYPMLGVESHAARTEFAHRRSMAHMHELLRLTRTALQPGTLQPPSMYECFEAIKNPRGAEARHIIAFAAKLGMTAIHPQRSREHWPQEDGGVLDKDHVATVGNAALGRLFSDCKSVAERCGDETNISNRCLCHACGPYCLRPVLNKRTGKPLLDSSGKPRTQCRFRPELKQQHACTCPECDANLEACLQLCEEVRTLERPDCSCQPLECSCCGEAPAACGCETIIWQLPGTFRFELRIARNHTRLQVGIRPLTHGVRGNYDVQFIIDYASVVEYILKYVGKPEGKSDTFKELMRNVFRNADPKDDMVKLCAEAINVQLGKRDFSDTEICHLLNELPLMEYSDCFSEVFHMDGRQALEMLAGDSDVDMTACFAHLSREQWYTSRPTDFEDKCSWWVLQHLQGNQYAMLDGCQLTPRFSPFFPVALPAMGYEHEQLTEKQLSTRMRQVDL